MTGLAAPRGAAMVLCKIDEILYEFRARMFGRVAAIALNTYREAVRARVLFALFGAALASIAGSLVIASMSLHQEARVIADIGAGLISLCSVVVAIVLGATSLYREVELKTVFPILTRELRRHEYVIGKYIGTLLTLLVFILVDGGAVLALLGGYGGGNPMTIAKAVLGLLVLLGVILVVAKGQRVFVALPWSVIFFAAMAYLASPAADERRLLIASCALAFAEVAIVCALATLFASFSSPYFTALFTLGIFAAGRSTDTMANLPEKLVGAPVRSAGMVAAKILPNLHAYVPPRPLLLGHIPTSPVWPHVGYAAMTAFFYVLVLVTASALVFQKRDFQ